MKIFALYLRVNLAKKPQWFDAFREKNNGWFELHITLIQPRFVNDEEIPELKEKIQAILGRIKLIESDKTIMFDKPVFEELPDSNYLFMWFAKENIAITALQNELVGALSSYDNYCEEVTKRYEADFKPHITVVESIDAKQKIETEQKLLTDNACEGIVVDLALVIVKDRSKEERENPNNFTMYAL